MATDKEEERLMKKKLEEMKKRFGLKEDKAKSFEIEIEVGDDDFQEKVIEMSKKVPVLVDFYADWCLVPGTEIITNPLVQSIEKITPNSKVLSFDKEFREKESKVKSVHSVISYQNIRIITQTGKEIICTPDHLILTSNGFKKAGELKVGDMIGCYLFSNNFYKISGDNRFFLTEEKILNTLKELKLNKKIYIDELREKDLLNIRYNEEKAYILASLLGLLLTDGSLSMAKNNERYVEFFVGTDEDAKEVVKELEYLGFHASLKKISRKGEIAGRKFVQKGIRIRVSRTALFVLFKALGGIVGDKFINGLKIPEWILSGPKEIQRAFLQGFLGGDGPKVVIKTIKRGQESFYNKALINPLEFHFYAKAKNSSKNFIKQITQLLSNFNVKVRKVEVLAEKGYKRKDRKQSKLIRIWLKNDLENACAYASIGFKFSHSKKLSSALARIYLKQRLSKIKEREKLRLIALKMKNTHTITEISKKLKLDYSVIYNWFKGSKAFPPHDTIPYEEWLKKYVHPSKKIFFDEIKSVKRYTRKNEFISLSLNGDTKMYVGNEIIHHNCPPCKILSPTLDKIARDYNGKLILAKVNVDKAQIIANEFGIMSIPTVILFKNGEPVDYFVGALPETQIKDWLKRRL